ncbi:MAG: ABC-type transport auxiliary lipoprotein family protein [Nitratireductor sp.]
MEFNARYLLIAIFALAALAGGAGFVYWLENSGGFGPRTEYRIVYPVSVSGMARGGKVLFNGLQVGEIRELTLDANRPDAFVAIVSVDSRTPVREDTTAGIDYEGLTGAANVMLTGGTAQSPLLQASNGEPATIIADPLASRSWTQAAARALGSLETVFSGNKDRFENILKGLERMTGGAEEKNGVLTDLLPPKGFPARSEPVSWQLAIGEPSVLLSLNTDKVLELKSPVQWAQLGSAKWTDNLPNLFQTKLIQGFENAGLDTAVLRPADALDPENRLNIDIRYFHFRAYENPAAIIDLYAKIVDRDGGIVASRRFTAEEPSASTDPDDAIAAMGTLFTNTAREIITWSEAQL